MMECARCGHNVVAHTGPDSQCLAADLIDQSDGRHRMEPCTCEGFQP